jgi:hypothetical protein
MYRPCWDCFVGIVASSIRLLLDNDENTIAAARSCFVWVRIEWLCPINAKVSQSFGRMPIPITWITVMCAMQLALMIWVQCHFSGQSKNAFYHSVLFVRFAAVGMSNVTAWHSQKISEQDEFVWWCKCWPMEQSREIFMWKLE